MSPYRVVGMMLRNALQTTPENVTLAAMLAAAAGTVFAPMNVLLGILWIIAVVADQLSGMLRAYVEAAPGEDWFRWDKVVQGLARKGLVLMALIVAGSIDVALAHLGTFGDAIEDITPLTKGALAYALLAVWGSILQNAARVKEARGLAEFIARRLDQANLGGQEPPVRRHYDPTALQYEAGLEKLKTGGVEEAGDHGKGRAV